MATAAAGWLILGVRDTTHLDEHKGLRDNDNQVAACLTFAETAWIDRDTVFKVARRYPKALAHLGWVARRDAPPVLVRPMQQGLEVLPNLVE